ncbi:MAG: quinoprotein glucose dehydrogenase, partial [Mariniblastus sp.]
ADLLANLMRRVTAGDFPAEISLDVLLAAEARPEQAIKDLVSGFATKNVKPDEPASKYILAKMGGSADRGSKIFYEKTEVSCVRCHRIDGTGGKVGPDLSGIALTKDRQYLLESIVHPNKVVAEGFSQLKVLTIDGDLFVGIIKRETDDVLVLLDADGKDIEIEQDAIEDRKPGKSSMPDDLIKNLTQKEIRDLVEFLGQLKSQSDGSEHE